MRLSIPRALSRAVEEIASGYVFTRDWSKYLRNVWTILGFDPSTGMYADMHLDLVQHPSVGALGGSLGIPQLTAGAASAITKQGSLPNNWCEATSLHPYIEWGCSAGAVGDVLLALGYAIGSVGDVIYTETEDALAAITVQDDQTMVRTTFTAISGAALAKSDVCMFAFKRLGDQAGDTSADAVYVYRCGVKILVEGIGHEKEHP